MTAPHHGVRPKTAVRVSIAITALAVAAALGLPYAGVNGATWTLLMLASTGFVGAALCSGGWHSRYGRLVVAALALCWLGDLLGPYDFATGAVMFLLAHLVFVGAFLRHGVDRQKCLTSLLLLVPSGFVLCWLLPQVEQQMRPLVVVYTTVITAMVVIAGGTRRLIFVGAVVFYVSDIFVARWRFVDQDPTNALFCYPLYYAACTLLAVSVRGATTAGSEELNDG